MDLDLFQVLSCCRFIQGLGIGGEYPLAASNTAENANSQSSSRQLALVFVGVWVGHVVGPSIVLLLAWMDLSSEVIWRAAFLVGAAVALLLLVLRLLMSQETAHWKQLQNTAPQTGVCAQLSTFGAPLIQVLLTAPQIRRSAHYPRNLLGSQS